MGHVEHFPAEVAQGRSIRSKYNLGLASGGGSGSHQTTSLFISLPPLLVKVYLFLKWDLKAHRGIRSLVEHRRSRPLWNNEGITNDCRRWYDNTMQVGPKADPPIMLQKKKKIAVTMLWYDGDDEWFPVSRSRRFSTLPRFTHDILTWLVWCQILTQQPMLANCVRLFGTKNDDGTMHGKSSYRRSGRDGTTSGVSPSRR